MTAARATGGDRDAGRPAGRGSGGYRLDGGDDAVPLETGRARGLLTGLGMFGTGFAVAAVLVTARMGGTPGYFVSVTAGLVGVGLIGFFLNRGTVPLPPKPIWSPVGIAALARALNLPFRPLLVTLYVLGAIGVAGNLVLPMVLHR
ncbi:MAG TPA: hypothetical protein VFP72_09395 [Kineosporiaceae bacterium]|nr:hypothetical protein [Kineosporiaceae bacterium]